MAHKHTTYVELSAHRVGHLSLGLGRSARAPLPGHLRDDGVLAQLQSRRLRQLLPSTPSPSLGFARVSAVAPVPRAAVCAGGELVQRVAHVPPLKAPQRGLQQLKGGGVALLGIAVGTLLQGSEEGGEIGGGGKGGKEAAATFDFFAFIDLGFEPPSYDIADAEAIGVYNRSLVKRGPSPPPLATANNKSKK